LVEAIWAHADTAQALAEAGFVVVAPMHPGDNFQDDRIVGSRSGSPTGRDRCLSDDGNGQCSDSDE
jgi:predicted dienelactone hydrolase